MNERFKVPSDMDLRNILGILYDGINITAGQDLTPSLDIFLGLYVDDEDLPVATCICDINFAAYSSSALTMLPPGVAEGAVRSGNLEEMMTANLAEVFNILSRLFMNNDTDHLRLKSTHYRDSADGELCEFFGQPSQRVSFELSFQKYGSGILNFLVA